MIMKVYLVCSQLAEKLVGRTPLRLVKKVETELDEAKAGETAHPMLWQAMRVLSLELGVIAKAQSSHAFAPCLEVPLERWMCPKQNRVGSRPQILSPVAKQ